MKIDLAVVFSPVGGGHKAAALALADAARVRGLSVEVLSTFDFAPRAVGDAYLQAHLTGQNAVPYLYGAAYFAANQRGGCLEPLRHTVDYLAFGALIRAMNSLRPRAVVATHHLPLVVLGHARRRGRLDMPLFGVVTDYTSHACWAEAGVDGFAVACPEAAHELEGHGVAHQRIAVTGIPVRAAFERINPVREPERGEPLRVLVTSGGFGVGPMRHIVRSFAGQRGVQLTVVCGASERTRTSIAREARWLGLDAEVVGFESDMPRRMQDAHIVVGKAGGLTVSETLAAGRPMIVVNAIPGNEKLNEAYVVRGGAGICALPESVGVRVRELRERAVIAAMGRSARALVPWGAADRIARLACAA